MFKANSFAVILTLASVVALGPLSTDMYLPALPGLTTVFTTSIDQVQITLSVFLLGFAVTQLIYGPLADRFGRKPVLLAGLALFIAASLGCSLANTIEQLISYRFLQALGACAGPVLGRTIVRDIHGPVNAAKVLSMMGTIMALAPAIAPILGGYMVVWFSWSSIFWFLTFYGAIAWLLIAFKIPESLDSNNRSSLRIGVIISNYGTLLRHRVYMGYTLACSFIFSGLFAFLSGSSFVLIDYFSVNQEHYGLFFAMAVGGYMTGTQIAQRLGPRLGINTMLLYGAILGFSAGLTMVIPALINIHNLWLTVLTQVFFMMAVGIVMPQAMAGALAPFSAMTGTASSLLGFTQSIIAACAGLIVGHFHDGSPTTMAITIALMGMLSLLSFYFLVGPQRAKP
ncbi:MAG: Bcr/CflA family multidrug efflux MFS transporter [Amphritea sp.]|nr:Bcr/CflA family multidrug efflux MFS transporter [Amphritea sp.]